MKTITKKQLQVKEPNGYYDDMKQAAFDDLISQNLEELEETE